jgi:hypothetical protein
MLSGLGKLASLRNRCTTEMPPVHEPATLQWLDNDCAPAVLAQEAVRSASSDSSEIA